jgi:hypothetical protein
MHRSVLSCASRLLLILFIIGCGESEPPVVEQPPQPVAPPPAPEPPAPPEPEPIALAELAPVTLLPGQQATVPLVVQRNENQGPIAITTLSVPAGISITAPEIPPDKSEGQVQLTAALTLGDTELKAGIPVAVAIGEQRAERMLQVVVPKIQVPTLQPVSAVLLQPGTSRQVEIRIARNGFAGPLALTAENVPPQLAVKVPAVAAQADTTTLELNAAADAPDARQDLRLAATLYGRQLELAVPVQIARRPYHVNAYRVVTIQPGETQRIQLPVERSGYDGQFQVAATDLPPGVSARVVEVAPGEQTATVELSADAGAEQRVRSAKIVSRAGNLSGSSPIVIRVSRHDDTYLPPAIAADPEIAPLLRRGSMGGRLTSESKWALLDFYGGTPESEAAVMRGLDWLARHQQADGSWLLNDYGANIPGCDCQTPFEKTLDDSVTAATAFGVLAFLGAGVTHNRAPKSPPELAGYQSVVEQGLSFLGKNQVLSGDKDVGYLGGSMYAHTLGAIAFCEAYGLSGDERAKINAQLAIKYLLDAQHEQGGGWRYSPGQPGDMSVTGWVILAIRSAQLAGLTVERPPLIRAERFVDSCAAGPEEAKSSRYAYQPGQEAKLALCAAGLLTRQYLGWRKDQPELLVGSQYLMQNLPPESGGALGPIYYYYYATQVLHHLEGENFDLWNHRLREHLIRTQERAGHRAGSWNPEGTDHGHRGGRIYATAMAILTLETYYRHLPMYRPVKYASN